MKQLQEYRQIQALKYQEIEDWGEEEAKQVSKDDFEAFEDMKQPLLGKLSPNRYLENEFAKDDPDLWLWCKIYSFFLFWCATFYQIFDFLEFLESLFNLSISVKCILVDIFTQVDVVEGIIFKGIAIVG